MNPNEIRSRTIGGLSWSFVLSVLTVPAAFAINIMLGRQGRMVLGVWASLNLVVNAVSAFLLFGGGPVLVRFLPHAEPRRRLSLIVGYALVIAGFGIVGIGVIVLSPALVQFLAARGLDTGILPWFVAIVPLTLAASLCNSALSARMEIKWVALIGNGVSYVNLIGLAGFVFLLGPYFSTSYRDAMMFVLLASSVFSVVLVVWRLSRTDIVRDHGPVRPYLPEGFWRYSVFLHLVTVITFLVQQSDQALVLGSFDAESLGVYKAALAPAEFVRWFPLIANATLFPAFSNLLALGDRRRLERAYGSAIRLNSYVSVLMGCACVLFGHEILSLFGQGYGTAYPLLIILAASFVLSATNIVCSSLIAVVGRTDLLLAVNGLVVAVQIAMTQALAGTVGVTAAASGRAAAIACSAVAYSALTNHLLKVRVPRVQFVLAAVTGALLLVGLGLQDTIGSTPFLARVCLFATGPCLIGATVAWRLGDLQRIRDELLLRLRDMRGRRSGGPEA